MARVKPISEIAGLSGKLSKNDDYYLYFRPVGKSHNKVTGKTETRKINYNRHRKPTKAQVASRTAFKEKQDVVIAWFNEIALPRETRESEGVNRLKIDLTALSCISR